MGASPLLPAVEAPGVRRPVSFECSPAVLELALEAQPWEIDDGR